MVAFLACVGYKVFYYALKFCDMQPEQFMPAAFVGIALYFVKALHIGNPTIMMPLGLLLPLAIFYGPLKARGFRSGLAQRIRWLFPEVGNEPFWWVWTDSVATYESINFTAWASTLPDLAVMIIVSTMDCVLKIHATQTKLPLKPDSDAEAVKFGLFNFILACCGGAVGYMQLKFNVISYGVMRNATDRRAGFVYSLLCAACYFSTVEHFNYLPKLFLSALLFFAGAGFVIDNMYGSRKFLHLSEWLEIVAWMTWKSISAFVRKVIIIIVFIASGQLIFAVLAGVQLLAAVAFIAKYAKVPAMAGRPHRGDEVTTRDRPVGEVGHQSFMHIASEWIMVVHLKGYVFFSSCVSIVQCVEQQFIKEEKNKMPSFRRVKFIVFDSKAMDGMDASGAMGMLKLTRKAGDRFAALSARRRNKSAEAQCFIFAGETSERDGTRASRQAQGRGIRVLWCGLEDALAEEMRVRDILKEEDRFSDLDAAMTHLEKRILQYKAAQQREWMNLHPAFRRDRILMEQRINFEPFREVFLSDGARLGCPWRYCSRLSMKSFKTLLCVPGDLHRPLYLIHTGAVAMIDAVPKEGGQDQTWQKPRIILRQGWFVNANSLFGQPSNSYAVAVEDGEVLFWTEEQWWKMSNEHPLMMMEISKAVMRQQGSHHLHRDPEAKVEKQLDMSAIDRTTSSDKVPSTLDIVEEEEEESSSEEEEIDIPGETTVLGRKSEASLCAPVHLGDAFSRDVLVKLPQLQTRILEMHFARALGELGFFAKKESLGVLPQLPKILLEDLRVAFFTFAEKDGEITAAAVLPKGRVIDALLY
ncbi:unnamed protein product, partial [Effrenium voratum]